MIARLSVSGAILQPPAHKAAGEADAAPPADITPQSPVLLRLRSVARRGERRAVGGHGVAQVEAGRGLEDAQPEARGHCIDVVEDVGLDVLVGFPLRYLRYIMRRQLRDGRKGQYPHRPRSCRSARRQIYRYTQYDGIRKRLTD